MVYIKLGLDCGILNLGIMGFILIYRVLGLNNYFRLYIFLDIYICSIFVFAWAYSAILLAEYEFMTRGACCKFISHFYFVLFLLVLVNIRLYIFIECVQN